jgi:anti-sigma factor RsiW
VRKYLSAFQDNELDVRTNIQTLEHLEMCEGCSARLEEHRLLQDLVASHISSIETPAGLREIILDKLSTAGTRGVSIIARWREFAAAGWFRAAVAAASIIVVFGLVYGVLLAPPAPLNRAAASAHVAWLSDQVPSFFVTTDAERARKLATFMFRQEPSMSVLDNPQFELVGSGPAEIEGRKVGHFVFRYKAATVSMFIFEGLDISEVAGVERESGATTFKVDSRGGMNLVAWTGGNFTRMVVSSLPASDLMRMM